VRTLADTSLSGDERRLLEAFAAELRRRLGGELRAVWLYGSRARGEPPAHEDSDVDVLVLLEDRDRTPRQVVWDVLFEQADQLGLGPLTPWFSLHVHDVAWLAGRREIRAFFIQEVDRDKVEVIQGEPSLG